MLCWASKFRIQCFVVKNWLLSLGAFFFSSKHNQVIVNDLINPFSPNSNYQHQISPCKNNAYSNPEVMRIRDMITQGEFS